MQALVITAYKDMKQLLRIIDEVDDRCWIYIHLDKKANFFDKLKCEIEVRHLRKIHLESTFSVVWGGYNHLFAILGLLRRAVSNPDVDYIHVISGQDYFTKGYAALQMKFEDSKKIFMTCSDIVDCSNKVRERLYYPIISSNLNSRNLFFKLLNILGTMVQKSIKYKRMKLGKFREVYKGMVWVSLPKEAARYVIKYTESDTTFLKALKHTFIPEEFFFQTILMNSEYRDSIVKDNLRYTVWETRNGNCPAILDMTDYENMIKSDAIFARKIDSSISVELVKKLVNVSHTTSKALS